MDKAEYRNEILKILLREIPYASPGRMADLIAELIAPGLEKAKKWDRLCTITNPAHLYALAEWIDLKYPNDSDPEVQTELRKMGDIMAGNVVDALEGERK